MSGAINSVGSQSSNVQNPTFDSPTTHEAPKVSHKITSNNDTTSEVNQSQHVTNVEEVKANVSATAKNAIATQRA